MEYSSPSQLRYPQLSYFRSYAIFNWVQKNQVKLFFSKLRYFPLPVTLFSSFSPQTLEDYVSGIMNLYLLLDIF